MEKGVLDEHFNLETGLTSRKRIRISKSIIISRRA